MAEIERENIRTQTMAGREQKAREGKWNGGVYGIEASLITTVVLAFAAILIMVIGRKQVKGK